MNKKINIDKNKIKEAVNKFFEFEDNFNKDLALVEYQYIDGIKYFFDPTDNSWKSEKLIGVDIFEKIKWNIINKYWPKTYQKIEILEWIKTIWQMYWIKLVKLETENNDNNSKEMSIIGDEINSLQVWKLLIINSAVDERQKERLMNFVKQNPLLDLKN